MVVQGGKKLVGIECDGEKYHGPDRWEYDQRREAQLRRAGWKFWRISGSSFYRDKDGAMDSLWSFLRNEGIRPKLPSEEGPEVKEKVFPSGGEGNHDREATASQNVGPSEKCDCGLNGSKKNNEIVQPGGEKRENVAHPRNNNVSKDRIDQVKELLDPYGNWRIWQKLISWGEGTDYIDSFSRAISYQIIDKLKLGRKFNPWLRKEMERIWKTAIKKGFRPEL